MIDFEIDILLNKKSKMMEKHLRIISIKDEQNDLEYWMTRSAQERIDALELLRSQFYQLQSNPDTNNVQQRLQRVLTITQRKIK